MLRSDADTTSIAAEEEGMTVYRVFGGEAKALGHSWTDINPAIVKNYRNIAEGVLKDFSGVTYRQALPLHGNVGGLSEYLLPNPIKQIEIRRVFGVNPEF